MTARERVLRLVERLPESELPTAERVLEALAMAGDPVARALAAALEDDEPLTDADEDAIAEGHEAYRRGEVIDHEEARRRLLGT